MRQAIQTLYLGPTNSRGSRVMAKAQAGKVTIAYDDSLDNDAAHAAAAEALIRKHEWYGRWNAGGAPDGRGNVYTMLPFISDSQRCTFRAKKIVIIFDNA